MGTPLRYIENYICPASEFQTLLYNGYSITNGGYINDIWAEDNNFHDWLTKRERMSHTLYSYVIWI